MLENIKFRKVEQLLIQELLSPAYKINDKIESENALVKKFKVSKVTIRTALRRLEEDGILLCEHGKRRVLIKKPENKSRIRSGMSFGFFMRGEYLVTNNDLLEVSKGIAEGLKKWNADLSILPMPDNTSELEFVKRVVGRNMVDGLFITNMDEGKDIINYMKSINFPCVSFNHMENGDPFDSSVPHVGLREKDVLNNYAMKYNKIHIIATSGHSMDRTCQLLDPKLPFEIHTIQLEQVENALSQFLKFVDSDDLILIASLDLLPFFDMLMNRKATQVQCNNVLVFKHCPADFSQYKGRYKLFDRPMQPFGEEIAMLMKEVILHHNACEEIYNCEKVIVDTAVREIL